MIVKRDVLAGPQVEHLTSVIGDGRNVFPVNRQRVVRGHGRAGGIPQPYFRTYYPRVPFDLTKVWPHADYPLIEVGKLVLDRNPAARAGRSQWIGSLPDWLAVAKT